MSKKRLAILVICFMLFTGCGKNNVTKTYNQSEQDGVVKTYYEMNDGTWKCNDTIYQYRLELDGRMPNAVKDSYYVVLTDDETLSFEAVSKSLYSSLMKDIDVMKGSVIVEMK